MIVFPHSCFVIAQWYALNNKYHYQILISKLSTQKSITCFCRPIYCIYCKV